MPNHIVTTTLLGAAMAIGLSPGMVQHEHGAPQHTSPAAVAIPASIQAEHRELQAELGAAAKLPGRTGEAARGVAAVLNPHFQTEEEIALPPLGLLAPLAAGQVSPSMRDTISLADRLKAELPRMLDEHKVIVNALDELVRAGKAERHPDVLAFADKLKLHAQTEEQVLYPAAIVVGEYLKVKLPK